MKLGLLTAAFPTLTLDEIADWAAENGFDTLEVACWPAGEGAGRRYAGVCHIDVDALDDAEARRIVDGLARRGLSISALAYYPNPLDPDDDAREATHAHLRKVMEAAARLGVPAVGTFAGNDRHRPVAENLERFAELWPPLVRRAGELGVQVVIENCPMIFSDDEWPGGNNLAYNPYAWRAMFDAIPDAHFGLNLDPSHLVWQMIDIERVIYEFADRILHVHAKDLEVRRDGLYERGVMSAGVGWQVPRLCGHGQVDWNRFIGALYAVGYDGAVSIEHEDRRFEGSVELVQKGFLVARNTLRPLIA
ncbi:MAG TPA: sugar phosphate isomerase/epimerase [Capillimicrobium sp.]